MDLWDSFLLGLLQGLTEFLPVSSSGHLVLAQALFDIDSGSGITFEVMVHFGTLCSIFVYYKKDIVSLLQGALRLLKNPRDTEDPGSKLVLFILLSMIPAMIAGFLLKDLIEDLFQSPVWVSCFLIITGFILFSTKFIPAGNGTINSRSVLGMGITQAIAIIPGISRSGSTIAAGRHLGLNNEESARFSFLMVIPVIAGATLLELGDAIDAMSEESGLVLLVGFLTAAISGFIALKFLINMLKKHGIHPFAWYCWLAGAGSLLYFLL